MKRLLTAVVAIILSCVMVLSLLVMPSVAQDAKLYNVTGEQSRTSSEITLADGTKTGVQYTNIQLAGHYGDDREVNVVEFDLADPRLSVEVINCGTYMTSSKLLTEGMEAYNKTHEGQTMLAGVNGDLWMTSVHSGSGVSKKVLKVPRGVLIVEGEIWASAQIDQENLGATNNEKGTPAGTKACFGVTSQNQPLVGSPSITVTMTVNGQTVVEADGINRLPAENALIVYNHRVNSTNYALDDAYEVELEVADSSAFKAGGEISATVKAIYPANSTTRPALDNAKTIVLTARGNRISKLQNNFKVGDAVTLSTTMIDLAGRTELWQDVQEAIGGHMQVLSDGKMAGVNGDSTKYPSAFIGYKDDGHVMMVTVTSTKDASRDALRFNQSLQFCTEMGYNSVFYLDGGGSTTFVTLEEGTYTVRNKCSDGSPRSVINGVGVVWNDQPVCEAQGDLSYIKLPVDMSVIPATYIDGALLADITSGPNQVVSAYDATEKAFAITTTMVATDPYLTMDLSGLQPITGEEYPYIVFKLKSTHKMTQNFSLYYACGNNHGAAAGRMKSFRVVKGGEWQYIVVDMSQAAGWAGSINDIRLDVFDSGSAPKDTTMYIGAIVFCKTLEEANKVQDGWAPEGAITDYLAYLESLKPVPETEAPTEAPETEAQTMAESQTEMITDAQTEAETVAEPMPETEEETTPATEEVTEATTVVVSEEVTTSVPEATDAMTQGQDEQDQDQDKGCASAMGGMMLLPLMAVAAWAVKKKREE